jgi:aspartate aminotransferase
MSPGGKPPRPTILPRIHGNLAGLGQSPTMAINETCDRLRREGKTVAKLGLGQSPFPVPVSVVDELRANAGKKEYLPVRGLPALREAVAEYHHRRSGVPCSPRDVIIGPGSKELMFLLQVVHDGELWVPTPAWVSYAPQAQIAGRSVRFLHTRPEDGWRLLPGDLEELCVKTPGRSRILILNYPGNPTGKTYRREELKALAEVCRRHSLIVLSDEIYGELHHRGHHVSIARYLPELTVLSGGLSKWCGAGGWRLGTFAFPPTLHSLLDAMAVVASETFTSTSAPIQYAAVRAFRGGMRIERYLRDARRILAALGNAMVDRLTAAGVVLDPPEGGFYLFPDFSPHASALAARGIHTGSDLCLRLLEETGVAILPAEVFGRSENELTARLAYVDFDGARALAAAEATPAAEPLDDAFLRTYCNGTLRAADRIADWLRALTPASQPVSRS